MKQNFWTYNKPLSMTGLGGGANSLLQKSSGGGEIILPNAGNVNGNAQQQEITISNFISAGQTIKIPSGLYVWSDDTSTPALTIDIACTIINEGIIMGRGGNGGAPISGSEDGGNGGSAIKINSGVTGVTITNSSGAYIFGGGGGGSSGVHFLGDSCGGGGGAGGGKGGRGSFETTSTAGGDIGASGSSSPRTYGGNGGENGGSGGSTVNGNNSSLDGASGGGGGRATSFGTAFAANVGSGLFESKGGNGGGFNNIGGNASGGLTASFRGGAGGGGGYGANGGDGAAGFSVGTGGKAIDDSFETYTLTNNGTIYGGT
jgi:hypothetical protein